MIIKGGSRGAPGQLARHLQRRDTNERVEIIELQSPAPGLGEAFRDWQTLVEGTRGSKGLYHANIDPAKDYTMTRDQWQRAVDVLEKELHLEGQPRAVVLHEKHGREHIHVVWARTDIDRMVLCSDSQNYLAHERASKQLEMEFGHEHVPGKHAKRDRDKQPEFPKAEANQAEWQQGERTGLDPAARKDQVTALKEASDNAQAFKTALEEQGYILAKGDRRDFVIVDEAGSIHSLGRQIRAMKAAELREFMKGIDSESLPTAAEAKELQQQRQQQHHQDQQQQQQRQEPQKEPPPQEKKEERKAEEKQEQKQEQKKEPEQEKEPQQKKEAEQEKTQQQEPKKETEKQPEKQPEAEPDRAQVEAEALRKAVAARQTEERRRLVQEQRQEMEELRRALERDTREKLDRFDAIQREQAEAREQRQPEEAPTGIAEFLQSMQDFFFPERARERAAERERQEAERERQEAEFSARQKEERDRYADSLQQANDLEIENVTDRQALNLHDQETRAHGEFDRYLREMEEARRLQAEIEERERQRAEERARDGPERPPPGRAR